MGMMHPQGICYLCAMTSFEEDQLAGIKDLLPDVPVFGGSAGDNDMSGKWFMIAQKAGYNRWIIIYIRDRPKLRQEFF